MPLLYDWPREKWHSYLHAASPPSHPISLLLQTCSPAISAHRSCRMNQLNKLRKDKATPDFHALSQEWWSHWSSSCQSIRTFRKADGSRPCWIPKENFLQLLHRPVEISWEPRKQSPLNLLHPNVAESLARAGIVFRLMCWHICWVMIKVPASTLPQRVCLKCPMLRKASQL